MSESRAPSPKFEVNINEPEEETAPSSQPGPFTRSKKKTQTAIPPKVELDLSTLLKFIKPYDGARESLNSFLVNCSNAHDLASEQQKDIVFKYILCQLQGKAQTTCSIKEFVNWPQLKDFLKMQFSERKHYAHLLTDLQECKQQTNESVSQYALKIETCLSQLLTEISITHGAKSREMIGRTAAMEELALHHFQMGLAPRISNVVRCKSPKTLNEAINIAISEEKIQQFLYKQNPQLKSLSSRPSFNANRRFQNQNPNNYNNRFPNPNIRFNNNNNSNRAPNHSGTNSPPVCRYCKHVGHTIDECRKREYNNNRNQNFARPNYQGVNFTSLDDENPNEEINAEEGYDTVDNVSKN